MDGASMANHRALPLDVSEEKQLTAEESINIPEDSEEFFLPSLKSDLVNDSDECFTFSSVLSLEEILEVLGHNIELKEAVNNDGIRIFGQNFQAVCSTIWHFDDMDSDFLEDFMKGLLAAIDLATDQLADVLKSSGILKKRFRSDFKVVIFLLCHYIEALQKQIADTSDSTSKKGGGKSKNHLEQRLKQLRCKALSALHTATDPKRHWSGLWDTGVPEKEYKTWLLNSLTRFCTDVDLISHKTEDAGTLAKAVGNVVIMGDISQDFWKTMMNLFRRNEACGNFTADVVNYVFDHQGMDIMDEAFREMEANMDEIPASGGETSMGLSYANLLRGLAKKYPVSAASCLQELKELLLCDAGSVRSACVQLIAAAIEDSVKKPCPDLDKKCLSKWWTFILAQMLDSNALVRNKVLSCVSELAARQCIPERRFRVVLESVIDRTGFNDPTQSTRKAALGCLRELLQHRLDLLKRTLAELQFDFCQSVEELIKCLDDDLSDDFMKPWIWEKKLIIMQQQMTEAALLFGKTREIRQDVRESVRGLDFKRVLGKLSESIDAADGSGAFHVLMSIATKFPEEKIVMDYHLQGFLGEHGSDVAAHRLLSAFDCLYSVVRRNADARILSESFENFLNRFSRAANDDIRAAANKVCRLKDDMHIRRLLTECVPRLEKTMQMSVVMDIVEISNFLIFADEEGFKEGAHVLRRLPSYFTSESRDIKEAAVSSYRRFFIGKSTEDSSSRHLDDLVEKLLRELPCISAPNAGAVRLMFRTEDAKVMKGISKKLVNIALSSDRSDDVWRSCLALSVLPACTDDEIWTHLQALQKKCLNIENYDPRLICTFCDVLIKIGRSPLDNEDITERGCKKLVLPAQHPLLRAFLSICIICFTDETGAGQTQMLGKIVEALFAVSEDPSATLRALVLFVLTRLKIGRSLLANPKSPGMAIRTAAAEIAADVDDEAENATDSEVDAVPPFLTSPAVPFQGLHYVLFMGAAAAFTFANWMEDVFSVNIESKENEKKPAGEVDENEPDGPSEEDRGKALVVQLRKSLFEGNYDGENSGIPLIEKMIVALTMDASLFGHPVSLVSFMALIRLMLINETYCKRHIKRVLKILETTESLELRKVLLIGFSDIAVRFVNLVQPHTDIFTQQLSHPDPTIRYHALMAFVRIIVNDLVKVREQHCDIAMLICDPDEQVADITKGFFKEKVSKQGVVNIIPQILARDDLQKRVDPIHLQKVMKYLIDLVPKNPTEIECLVKIFFQALESSRPVETWQTASFCLTLVAPHITEKILAQIREQIFSLKKATKDDETLGFLVKAFEALKRKLPEDKKRIADEIIKKLQQLSQDSVAVEEKRPSVEARSATAKASARSHRSRRPSSPQPSTSRSAAPPGSAKKRPKSAFSFDSSSDGSPKKSSAKNIKRRRGTASSASDASSSEEESAGRKKPTEKKQRTGRRRDH